MSQAKLAMLHFFKMALSRSMTVVMKFFGWQMDSGFKISFLGPALF